MDFIKDAVDQYVRVLKNYTLFEGRARRSEFWKFALVNFVISVVLNQVWDTLGMLYGLAVLVPAVAVGARRLHDIGKSGWWQLIVLIPFLGAILLIIFFVLDSEPKDNKYGANPKGGSTPTPTPTPTAAPMV